MKVAFISSWPIIMETIKKLPNSVRKFIRTQKAQIRRQFWDVKKQTELIKEMYVGLISKELAPVPVVKTTKAIKKPKK